MSLLAVKYHKELMQAQALSVGTYADAKLLDSRVASFLHFAQYSEVLFDYVRIGVPGKGGTIIRKGSSGTRKGTCDLERIPPGDRPEGPPLSQAVVIRYYDLSASRKAWRSFRRNKFTSLNAVLDDATGKFTTDFSAVVNSGQVPPPSFRLSKSQKRKLMRIIKSRKNGSQ